MFNVLDVCMYMEFAIDLYVVNIFWFQVYVAGTMFRAFVRAYTTMASFDGSVIILVEIVFAD